MKKSIFVVLVAMVLLPLTAYAWDSQDALEEAYRDSREDARKLNQWRRGGIIDDQRHAIEKRDWKEMEYQQRRLEQQLLRERIMGQ